MFVTELALEPVPVYHHLIITDGPIGGKATTRINRNDSIISHVIRHPTNRYVSVGDIEGILMVGHLAVGTKKGPQNASARPFVSS